MPAMPEAAYRAPGPQYPPQYQHQPSPSLHQAPQPWQAPPQAQAPAAHQQVAQEGHARVHIVSLMPDLPAEEAVLLQGLVGNLTQEQAARFAMMYRGQRLSPGLMLVLAIFFPIHRFLLGRAGTGVLYLITLAGFGWWWLIDLFLVKGMTRNRNLLKAQHIALLVKAT